MATDGSAASLSPHQETGPIERFVYDDAVVRKFLFASIVFGVVAFLVGVIAAIQLALPPALNWEIGGVKPLAWLEFLTTTSFLNFGRIRPLHTNAAIFAFAGNALFAAIYYSTQRLCKARMWSDKLSNLHFWGWQLIVVCAAVSLPLGLTQGKEYAELEWPVDLMIAVVWVAFFGVNFFMTLAKRRERHMYVALWFYIATIVTVAMLHVFNNLSLPLALVQMFKTGQTPAAADWLKSWSGYSGVQDAFMQWWYGHNAVAFFLTTPFLGLMYYFLPKAADRPVFSYRLSIIHFWSLVFIYIWAAPPHLHYTALPQWASTLGMLFSVMLWMPSWGGMINGLLTLRGAWNKVAADPILKFYVVGITFYGMSTFEGPMLSVKSVNSLSHYTDWTIAHVHAGALGWNGLLTFGMAYWLAPRLFQAPIWSKKLVAAHFWLATIGIALYILGIYTGGITQGLMWRAFDETGRLQYPDFVETVMTLMPFYWIRVIGGTLFLVGGILCLLNLVMTWAARPAKYEETVHEAPALGPVFIDPPPQPTEITASTEWAKDVDQKYIKGWFHRVWERKPAKFTIWVLIAIFSASLFEIVPTFLIKSNVPTIASVQPYTPLELAGRDIYISEGCYNCHSQMIRPIGAETRPYGEYSKAGEFVYDHPFQWGSRRIGPDLAREGGRQSHDWQMRHLENPRQLIPDSIMPAYPHLLKDALNFESIQGRVDAMAMLGVPYGDLVQKGKAIEAAKAQAKELADTLVTQQGYADMGDKKAIALLAYLQRLGTDISKPPPAEPAKPATASAGGLK